MLFDFNLGRAVESQLLERLNECPELSLATQLSDLIDGCGVYVLMYNKVVVYVGKASRVGLRRRLTQHLTKLQNHGFDANLFTYRVLYIGEGWLVGGAEEILIVNFCPLWNGTGFGNHPVGRGRPGIRPSKWETMVPVFSKK